ncbi:MAG: Rieske (2Fe-2S) protein [Bradyrhizobium sp.]
MAEWKKVIAEQDVRDDEITEASADDLQLILLRDSGEIFAYHHECPHEKHSLSNAEIESDVIVCQKHLWEFEIRTGMHITRVPMVERNLIRYPVRIINEKVEIDVASPKRWGET